MLKHSPEIKSPAFLVLCFLILGIALGINFPFKIFIITLIPVFILSICFIILKKWDPFIILILVLSSFFYTERSAELSRKNPVHLFGLTIENRIISFSGNTYSVKGEKLVDGLIVDIVGDVYSYRNFNYLKIRKLRVFSTLFSPIFTWRKGIINSIKTSLPCVIGDIGIALLLGEKSAMPDFIKERFRSCGAAHLLAVSGLHTGIIFLILTVLLSILPIKKNFIPIIASALLIPYLFLTGFRVSVVRAFIMLFIYSLGDLLQRKANPLNVVGVAGSILLLINPLTIKSISFQLSFLAVTGIIILLDTFKDLIPHKGNILHKYILYPAFITTSAQVFTFPVVFYNFGYIPLYSVFANIILIPITSLFISGMILMVSLPFLRPLTSSGVWFIGMSFNKIMMAFQHMPYSVITGRPSIYVFLIYPLLLLLLFLPRFRNSP